MMVISGGCRKEPRQHAQQDQRVVVHILSLALSLKPHPDTALAGGARLQQVEHFLTIIIQRMHDCKPWKMMAVLLSCFPRVGELCEICKLP